MSYADAYDPDDGIAIIGLAGRFPGARDVDEFWAQPRGGPRDDLALRARTSSSRRWRDEMAARAATRATCARAAFSTDIELFDAAFFGINPQEAEVLDPQQRVFLEAAWEALETRGLRPAHLRRRRSACSRA